MSHINAKARWLSVDFLAGDARVFGLDLPHFLDLGEIAWSGLDKNTRHQLAQHNALVVLDLSGKLLALADLGTAVRVLQLQPFGVVSHKVVSGSLGLRLVEVAMLFFRLHLRELVVDLLQHCSEPLLLPLDVDSLLSRDFGADVSSRDAEAKSRLRFRYRLVLVCNGDDEACAAVAVQAIT